MSPSRIGKSGVLKALVGATGVTLGIVISRSLRGRDIGEDILWLALLWVVGVCIGLLFASLEAPWGRRPRRDD